MIPDRYNIRVYGLCLDRGARILVTDERRGGYLMTKFPGGGHELGEGLHDALIREFREETDTEIDILGLFYINEFLQISAFNPKDQLLSIYYLVALRSQLNKPIVDLVHDFDGHTNDAQTFRWVPISDLDPSQFTFPIDKIVVEKILSNQQYLTGLSAEY
jgi:8-oxo-dGTP diphosphatase